MLVCVHEDRRRALAGVKLLVMSLRRHLPDASVVVSCRQPPPAFAAWLDGQPGVRRYACDALAGMGWDAKPSLLLRMLREGHESVWWLDSDIIVCGDFRTRLPDLSPRELVVSQAQYWDLYQHGSVRTQLWNLEVGREMDGLISTGVLRVTRHHEPLLRAWRGLLADPQYRRAQAGSLFDRPVHMLGDQDVLTALAGCTAFSDIPIRWLRRGRDIALTVEPAGYTVSERLGNVGRGLPPLVHCGGSKPWDLPLHSPGLGHHLRTYYRRVHAELGPYAHAARPYADRLDADETFAGLRVRTLVGRLCRSLALGEPSLQGLPQAAVHTVLRRVKHALGFSAWPTPQANAPAQRRPSGGPLVAAALATP